MADDTDFELPEAEEEAPVSQVRKTASLGKYINTVQRSWETDTALGVTVPAALAKKVESKFRAAAAELGMGIAIAHRPDSEGAVRVVIQAKEKRAYTPRKPGGTRKGKSTKK